MWFNTQAFMLTLLPVAIMGLAVVDWITWISKYAAWLRFPEAYDRPSNTFLYSGVIFFAIGFALMRSVW